MSSPTRGRRQPPDVPPLSSLPWASAAQPVYEALKYQIGAFDSLPAPHAETHHFGESDELIEFGDEFLLLVADALLPNARVVAISGGLGSTDAAGTFTILIADNGVTNAKLRDSIARSVIGRAANSAGDPADIQAANAGDVLQLVAGNTLAFAAAPVTPDTVVTPAQIVANQNDYALATGQINRLSTDASRDITGFVAAAHGTRRTWVNVGAFDVVLKHQNAGSAAGNRLLIEGAVDLTLTPDFAAQGWMDTTTGRWRVYAL